MIMLIYIFQLITNIYPITIMNIIHSSCTCGIDEIRIDSKMKRPIYIGVFTISNELLSNSLIRQLQQTQTIWSWWITSINTRRIHIINKFLKKCSTILIENEDKYDRVPWNTFWWVLLELWTWSVISSYIFLQVFHWCSISLLFFSHLPMCLFYFCWYPT